VSKGIDITMKSTKAFGHELLATLALSAGLLVGCGASVAPKELLSARDAYAAAEAGPAKTLAPVQLEEAKQALAEADDAFTDGQEDNRVRDLSYIAQKKSQIAGSKGKREEAERARQDIEKERVAMQEDLLGVRSKALRKTQAELDAEKAEKERIAKEGRKEVARTKAELAAERQARLDTEKKLSAALRSLDEIAQVKEEKRGVVITLSGSVLFATGKYTLLPIAKDRLNEVAKAVKDQGYKQIVVEGHTDSRGSASANQELSLKRAQEVRSHLISQGIDSAKITAVGRGEDVAIASNDSAEGRANNRRVELIVTPE
jgi:outer membrane protein OmpA-like peptidoglycan-associated protein